MRELLIFRHAKSSWSDPDLDDHDRPLNARGRLAAPVMGRHMRDNDIAPELVLCSTSERTRQTWDLAYPSIDQGKPATVYTREIYEALPAALMSCIHTVDPGIRSLMLLGHNPGCQILAMQLTTTADGDALQRLSTKFPTAALARIQFDSESWRDIHTVPGHLVQFITPKQLA